MNEEEKAQFAKAVAESTGPDGRLDLKKLFWGTESKPVMEWIAEQRAQLARQREIKEAERLAAREQELLEANTRLVEERRAVDLHAMVAQFHHAGGYPVRHTPAVPDEAEVRFRLKLITEEFFEMLDACFPGTLQRQLVADAARAIRQAIESSPLRVDLPELVDAWADLKYVVVGSEVTFGVDGNAVFRVVHKANLEKFGPGAHRDANGKTAKPPGWTPPDIEGELERQRREEAKRA